MKEQLSKSPRELEEGDTVRLKNDQGPQMIVKEVSGAFVVCMYFDKSDALLEVPILKSLLDTLKG